MRKETLSSFMDDELVNSDVDLSSLLEEKELQAKWHRYHIARQAMQNTLPPYLLPSHVTEKILSAIEDNSIDEENQPSPEITVQHKKNLFYPKITSFISKFAQIGVAACVTLAVIGGVQYYSNKKGLNDTDIPAFNTIPTGINISPVGGLNPVVNTPEKKISEHKINQKQYEKIYLLLQDHELQKRLNATK